MSTSGPKHSASKKAGSKKAATAEIDLASAVALSETSNNPLNDFQVTMVQHAFAIDSALPPHEQTDKLVSSIHDGTGRRRILAEIRARCRDSERREYQKPIVEVRNGKDRQKEEGSYEPTAKRKKLARGRGSKKAPEEALTVGTECKFSHRYLGGCP